MAYEQMEKNLSDKAYEWYIEIRTEKTAVFISVSLSENIQKTNPNNKFYFGKNDKWCITWCETAKSQDWKGNTANGYKRIFEKSDLNLNKLITANKNDEINVVFVKIGRADNYYGTCGIVFINGYAKYIYSDGIAMYEHGVDENVAKNTPEDIKCLLEICSSKMYNNSNGNKGVKQLFGYEFVMTIIRIYETYMVC